MVTASNIESKDNFCDFLERLYLDFKHNKAKWENQDLESFLEALSRYSKDIDGLYINIQQEENIGKASWQAFADILLGSTIYE